jgi:hypothetical protein
MKVYELGNVASIDALTLPELPITLKLSTLENQE